jgi:hypothetical protein
MYWEEKSEETIKIYANGIFLFYFCLTKKVLFLKDLNKKESKMIKFSQGIDSKYLQVG